MNKTSALFKSIAQVAKEEGTEVYLVGGYVRDFLLAKNTNPDWDFVVVGSGLEFAKKLDAHLKDHGSLVEFPDFDTARFVIAGESELEPALVLEFAGARSEQYSQGSRKPKVEPTTLAEDLARRDFTINAMALPVDLFTGKNLPTLAKVKAALVDPFNGQKDLKAEILRTPLDPDVTFSEDPLRMLRGVRFAAQLNFSIDPKTLKAIHDNRERIKIISGERVQEELLKLMGTKQPSVGLQLMWQTHLLDVVLPEISALDGVDEVFGQQHKNNLVHTFKVVDNVAEQSAKPWLRLAGLLHDIGKPATKKFVPKIGWTFHAHEHVGKKMVFALSRRLKLSKEHTQYLAELVRWHLQPIALMDEGITDSAVRRLVVTLGPLLDDLLILGRSDITTSNPHKKVRRLKNYDELKIKIAELLEKDNLAAFQSPFRGDEIMAAAKLKPGPTVGKIKTAIEEAILDGVIPNDHDAAAKYFETIKDEHLKHAEPWEKV